MTNYTNIEKRVFTSYEYTFFLKFQMKGIYMQIKDKLLLVAQYVRFEIEHEHEEKNPELNGTCVEASTKIQSMLQNLGIRANFVQGWVSYDMGCNSDNRSYDAHCWVETHIGNDTWYIDVTATQFNNFMLTEFEPIIVSLEKPESMLYEKPVEYNDVDTVSNDIHIDNINNSDESEVYVENDFGICAERQVLEVRLSNGVLRATPSCDSNYPGIDVEFIADDDTGADASRPRILIEKPIDEEHVRALIWHNKESEDYSTEIIFE